MNPNALLPLLLAPFTASQEPAAQESGAERAPQEPIPMITLSIGDLADMTQHPKDAGLLRACEMIGARMAELPGDFGGEVPPPIAAALDPGSMPTIMRILAAPKTIRMDLSPEMLQYGDMPLVFGFALHEDSPEAATQLESEISSLLQRMEAPVPPGMFYREESSIVLGTGVAPEPMGRTRAAAMLGDGVTIASEMTMDVGGYFRFIQAAMEASGAAPSEIGMMFDIIGRMGLDDCVIEAASTVDARTTKAVSLMTNVGGRMRDAGLLPEGGLTAAHLAPIPADATWASVELFDMAAAFDALSGLATDIVREQTGTELDVAAMIAATTGLDLRNGFFGALGTTWGMYASDTTGGGGLTSTVMYMSLRDADAFIETKEQLEEMLNGIAAANAQGFVAARTWSRGDGEYTTLTFPGLPVPMEPTIAMTEEWLVVAATPQAALGAMGQIESGDGGIAAHPMIAPLVAAGDKKAITYFDAAHFARSGYGMTSMALSSVSNAVRSRVDETRDPGPILPPYGEFMEGIVPTVGYGELVGDDYVNYSVGDGSTVVQCAAFAGFLMEHAAIFALPMLAATQEREIRRFLRGF